MSPCLMFGSGGFIKFQFEKSLMRTLWHNFFSWIKNGLWISKCYMCFLRETSVTEFCPCPIWYCFCFQAPSNIIHFDIFTKNLLILNKAWQLRTLLMFMFQISPVFFPPFYERSASHTNVWFSCVLWNNFCTVHYFASHTLIVDWTLAYFFISCTLTFFKVWVFFDVELF